MDAFQEKHSNLYFLKTMADKSGGTPCIRKNYAAFKDTFQKPSQIYRYLREKWKTSPLFLTRTLSYRRKRNPKSPHGLCLFNWICEDAQTSQKTWSIGFPCPWCGKDYNYLDPLMIHLKCCHPRFNFNLVREDGQSVIEMTLNHAFDGSYCGFKYPGHDYRRDFKFRPRNPERRTPTTKLIFFKPKKKHFDSLTAARMRAAPEADTFTFDEGEADVDVCSGRLYYHTSTCLPVKPNEVDIDSEADIDPDWLRERTQLQIDEFSDVNEGEKEMLKLWNLHIMRNYQYKGDHMMRQACLDFIDLEGQTILSKNLSKNFTLHLANLYDFGLISSRDLLDCIRKLNKRPPTASQIISPSKISSKTLPSSPAKRALITNKHCNQ